MGRTARKRSRSPAASRIAVELAAVEGQDDKPDTNTLLTGAKGQDGTLDTSALLKSSSTETARPAIGDGAMFCCAALDLAWYALIFWRPFRYSEGYSRELLVAHYLGVGAIGDGIMLALPAGLRQWTMLWRAPTSLCTVAATLGLYLEGLDGDNGTLTMARIVLGILRLLHAASFVAGHGGPAWLSDFAAFFAAARRNFSRDYDAFQRATHTLQLVFMLLAFSAGFQLFRFTHWNWEEPGFDGPLSAFQASAWFTNLGRVLALDTLLGRNHHRLWAVLMTIYATFWASQWIIMPPMFEKATVPYLHAVGDIKFALEAAYLVSRWNMKPATIAVRK